MPLRKRQYTVIIQPEKHHIHKNGGTSMEGPIQLTLNTLIPRPYTKSGCFFNTPALRPKLLLISYLNCLTFETINILNKGEKTRYLLICDTRKILRVKWIAVANRLQTTYGGGLAKSELNSHCS